MGIPTVWEEVYEHEKRLAHAAILSAIRLLADTVASLPIGVYRLEGQQRVPLSQNERLWQLLNGRPNEYMNAFTLRQKLMFDVLIHGNAYLVVQRDEAGRVVALHPLIPTNVRIVMDKDAGTWMYEFKHNDNAVRLPARMVVHIKAMSLDGITGESLLSIARDAVDTALAIERHAKQYFEQGGTPPGVIQFDTALTPEQTLRLQEMISAQVSRGGRFNAIVLGGGGKWQPIGTDAEKSQMLDSRHYSVLEVARIFRVPPHMIGELQKVSYNSVEQMSIEFVRYSLQPWLCQIENELNTKVLPRGYEAEFQLDALLRGDQQARYESYAKGIQLGVLTPNEARRRENLPPYPGGDVAYVPVNIQPVAQATNEQQQGMADRELLKHVLASVCYGIVKRTQRVVDEANPRRVARAYFKQAAAVDKMVEQRLRSLAGRLLGEERAERFCEFIALAAKACLDIESEDDVMQVVDWGLSYADSEAGER